MRILKEIIDLVKTTLRQWWGDDVFQLSAAVAFYTIFSLAPILLISVGIAGLVFSEQQVKSQIADEIQRLTGVQGGDAIRQVLSNLGGGRQGPKAILVGMVTVIIGSTAVFASLQTALNQIWHVRPKTGGSMWKVLVRVRMRSFGIVLAVGFLLLVSMVISAFLSGMQQFMAERMGQNAFWFWRLLNAGLSFLVVAILFALIYMYLPDVRIRWKDVSVGALITAILFTGGKYMIGIYLGQVAFGSTYGAAGSFVVMLIWIYYSVLICFYGAEFTQVYARRFGTRIQPEAHATRSNGRGL